MAHKNPNSAFFLIALILFATSNPLAHAQVPGLPGLPGVINGVMVNGGLCCTTTGSCPGTPVPGALVKLVCSGPLGALSVVVGQNTTGINGLFNITSGNIANVLPFLLGSAILPCTAIVNLPLNQTVCPLLAITNGVLTGVLGSVYPLLTQVLGLVVAANVSAFINVIL